MVLGFVFLSEDNQVLFLATQSNFESSHRSDSLAQLNTWIEEQSSTALPAFSKMEITDKVACGIFNLRNNSYTLGSRSEFLELNNENFWNGWDLNPRPKALAN